MRGNRPQLPRNHLYAARTRRGMSLQHVARKLGVSREAVRKWETGEAHPSEEHWEQLVELYRLEIPAPDQG